LAILRTKPTNNLGAAAMSYVLIHNPGCGSSKKGLEVLEAAGVHPEIRRYMLVAERLSVDELKEIARKMGGISPRAFMRDKDAADACLATDASDAEVFAAMAKNPKLIQRPIGINGDKAVLGRPNSALLTIV
ncbi:MAG: ArsC/Spx/MgsR family protein, partial [Hyphomonadaceae bacterium]